MKKIFLSLALLFGLSVRTSFAYYTGMNASVVVGQSDFTSNGVNQNGGRTAMTLNAPRGPFVDPNGRMIVPDSTNNRVLIWNGIPSNNNAPADLVLGQADFSSGTANRGGSANSNTLSNPAGVFSDGTRLVVNDRNNNRTLIWNTFPTTNGQAADVVVGQATMTATASTCDQATMNNPGEGVFIYQNKLIVGVKNQNRILIWNRVPTGNGVPADVVLSRAVFTDCGGSGATQAGARDPRGIFVDNKGRLYVVSDDHNRVMIWNSVPTTNNANADVVLGKDNFTDATTGVTSQNRFTLDQNGLSVYEDRLFLADRLSNRVLIFNSLPYSNGMNADIVLGQPNFTATNANAGGSISASAFNGPVSVFATSDKVLVSDTTNNRILIFTNDFAPPALSISEPESTGGDILRMRGTATVSDPYTIKNVEFSVNGSVYAGATPSDGGYASKSEEYFFDFNPRPTQPKDTNGNVIDGYTVRVRSQNTNANTLERLFYFTPFEQVSPADHFYSSSTQLDFSFRVNRQRSQLNENLAKYQIQVKRISDTNWSIYIDNIPIDFASVKGNQENIQREIWRSQNTNNGTYETDTFTAKYSEESSTIQVQSKNNSLAGSYQWKVVAVDKSGHTQDTGARNLTIGSTSRATNSLPIALLSISGISNSKVQSLASLSLSTPSLAPTFYGIAWGGSQITLRMTSGTETKTYTTVANMSSRFGINIPKGDLSRGKTYTVTVSTSLGEKYGEVYPFMLKIL